MASGALIGESMNVGSSLDPELMKVRKISRADCGDESCGQPRTWTFIEFELPDDDAPAWAEQLAGVLQRELGWYCDFRSSDETYVVFAEKVFRYPRGDRAGREAVAEYARSVGVPEAQLDWPE